MRLEVQWVTIVAMLLACAAAQAQIYTCKAEDGSTIYSDQRCGPDAKVFKSTPQTKKKPTTQQKAAPTPRVHRSDAELEELLQKCDAGDAPSCNAWTLGGGPNLLREKEKKAELDCEAGSLAACEERYCREGVSIECRQRVMRTARLAGDTWYVRSEDVRPQDGTTQYNIRCLPKDKPVSRDVRITCARVAGPNRCFASDPMRGHPGLNVAASATCSG